MNRLPTILAIACLLLGAGCFRALGFEHNATAVRGLLPGLNRDQSLRVLAEGGTVYVEREFAIAAAEDRAANITEPRLLAALARAEEESGWRAARAVVVRRHWGFAGFGVVHLFLNGRDELVGYHLWHLN